MVTYYCVFAQFSFMTDSTCLCVAAKLLHSQKSCCVSLRELFLIRFLENENFVYVKTCSPIVCFVICAIISKIN